MKVAMFTDSFFPAVDGALAAMEIQAKGLEDRGHEVVVFAPQPPSSVEYPRRVYYFPSIAFRSYRDYRIAFAAPKMMEQLRHEKVDVLHCHGLASMAILSLTAARAMKIPHVLTFHTMASEAVKYYSFVPLEDSFIEELTWIYLRNMMRRPELVIAPSSPIRDELISHGVRMRECAVVPTGVDCARFSPEKYDKGFLKRFGLEGRRVVLHVGRLSREKKLDTVLKAMANLGKENDDVSLLVIGKGPAEEYYKQLAKTLGIEDRVVWGGFLPDEDLPKAYASVNMLVLASTFETQGLVVLEAMASGIPVAGINFRAIPEFVKEGKNGTLFDESSCADGIVRCLARASSMKLNALATARRYSIDSCAAQLEKAYERAEEILRETH